MKPGEKEGVPLGQWRQVDESVVRPTFVTQQVSALIKLRDVLESQAAKYQAELQKARESLARLKHGGGS